MVDAVTRAVGRSGQTRRSTRARDGGAGEPERPGDAVRPEAFAAAHVIRCVMSCGPSPGPSAAPLMGAIQRPGYGRAGGSAPLLALGVDNERYWVKLISNRQGPMVPVNEQIVGRCGDLIDAPTCRVQLVEIPEPLSGLASGVVVRAGLAHGSLDVPDTINQRRLDHRYDDDNVRRHAGLFALHDWCWGADSQWLFSQSDEYKTYSHDHGYFFPGGPDWPANLGAVRAVIDHPHRLQDDLPPVSPAGLHPDAVGEVAAALDAVSTDDLVEILTMIPPEWPVSDTDLEAIGFFLERRAPQVAARMRSLVGGS